MNTRRWSDHSRDALVLARREALSLRHDHIGTEHLILGLLGAREGRAAAVLRAQGVRDDQFRRAIVAAVGRGGATSPRDVRLTWRAQQAIHFAALAARPRKPYRRLGWQVGTAHLLLGIVLDGEDLAIRTLRSLGVPPEHLLVQLRHVLRQGKDGPNPHPPDRP